MKKSFILIVSFVLFAESTPLNIINNIRTNAGASRLGYSNTLSIAAKKHALYLHKNHSFTHYESRGMDGYYAETPWLRIAKAGYPTKAVGEDISFYEANYRSSIKKLMGTVYHRLSLLDIRFNKIGYSSVHKIYVYDLSNSLLGKVCKKNFKRQNADYITDICSGGDKKVSSYELNRATYKVKRASKSIVRYPYNNQTGVPLKNIKETPKFLYDNMGFVVTATINDAYYKKIDLVEFSLKNGTLDVDTHLVIKDSDPKGKIQKGTYVLAPIEPLKSSTKYNVLLKVLLDEKSKSYKWSFKTRP